MNLPIPNESKGLIRWLRVYPGDAITIGIILVVVVIVFGYVWPFFREMRSFDRLEQRARRRITAQELQTWATNFLAQRPPGRYRVEALGTNFPKQLAGLWRHPPSVLVFESRTNHSGSADPGWVLVAWGSGFLGSCGFEIGDTNFAGYKQGHKWSDGVYFWGN